jgi:hypothetical protein
MKWQRVEDEPVAYEDSTGRLRIERNDIEGRRYLIIENGRLVYDAPDWLSAKHYVKRYLSAGEEVV